MGSLILISGERTGEFLPLGQRVSVIGRAESLPLQILDDLVSRRHFRVRFDKDTGKYYAEDMGSRHGTFVNLRMITQVTALVEGDEILIGQTKLLFTEKDFDTRESALMHWKKVGEKSRPTRTGETNSGRP
jgi:pSer/pThr/pTyr-binding forkhead associated (FHA) protein